MTILSRRGVLRSCQMSILFFLILEPWLLSSAFIFPHGRRIIRSLPLSISSTPNNDSKKSFISKHHEYDDGDDDDSPQSNTPKINNSPLSAVEFIDPETNCNVVLLGCFHGTESSSNDVERVVTADTDAIALELCASRFTDLKRGLIQNNIKDNEGPNEYKKPWMMAYLNMISNTIRQRGIPTGIAAAVLGGFSGIQTALSGFTPGLEFTTALKRAQEYNCDVILADQDVDETLRRVGSLPNISVNTAVSRDRLDRWQMQQNTLFRAIMGQDQNTMMTTTNNNDNLPQVQLPAVLLRNPSAIKDLVRLTIPPTLFFWALIYGTATIAGIDVSNADANAYYESATWMERSLDWCASAGIVASGYVGFALPAVGVILTERDEMLTNGIKAACRRAGNGGRVVAVLGLLHVNGVAQRMLTTKEIVESEERSN